MSVKTVTLGHAQMLAMSVSFSGELAYELHVPNEQLYLTWKILTDAGRALNLSLFGLYATESMRLEKAYRHWKADLIYEFNPMESALERFVNLDKANFIGKQALLTEIKRGPRKRFVCMTINCEIAAAHIGDPVFHENELIGSITSGAYGHRVQKNIALAFIEPAFTNIGTTLEVQILGEKYLAQITDFGLYDPENKRVRA